MGEKPNQTSSNLWSPIIGVIGIVIGAALGFFGAQASAQAQIEAAKINIYGPIYTTQTAEARGIITPATVVLSVTPENQLTLSQSKQHFLLKILYSISLPMMGVPRV